MRARHIVWAIAAVVIATAAIIAARSTDEPASISRDGVAMDTFVSISLWSENGARDDLELAADEIFETLTDLELQMSITSDTSDISRLSATPTSVPEDLFRAVEAAVELSDISGGAYDPTIGAITELWRYSGEIRVPERASIERALASVGADGVELTYPDKIALKRRGARLDLGGIAKGYASYKIAAIARDRGATSAIINMGGNVMTVGDRPGGGAWRIGIQDPRAERGTPIAIVETRGGSVITAGLYERTYEIDGETYTHIYDPSTGMPISGSLESVTVIADDPTAADALSTAFIVMGIDRALDLIDGLPSCEAVFIERTESGRMRITATRGLEGSIKLSDRDDELVFAKERSTK